MVEWHSIKGQDFAKVHHVNTITNIDRKVLESLYQPIIGAKAVALYHYFYTVAKQFDRLSHQTMLIMLQFNVQEFFEARKRLEAIGLLKTFYTENESLDRYVYELQAPLSPKVFFTDPIYCGLLMEQVTESYFEQIKEQFMYESVDLTSYREVSHKFHHVYGAQLHLYNDQDGVYGDRKAELQLDEDQFDWVFFNQLINGTYISQEQLTIDVKQAIVTIHQLYGLTPLEMREFVLQAHSMVDNAIHVDRLYTLARSTRRQQDRAEKVSGSLNQASTDALITKGYPEAIVQLIRQCQQLSPVEFIQKIKEDKSNKNDSGMRFPVEDKELRLIERLTSEYLLDKEVVNALVYYVLKVMDATHLTEAYVRKVANDWVDKKIVSADQAFDYVRQRGRQKANQQASQKSTAKKRSVKRITLTEAERQALNDVDKPASIEDIEKIFN